MSVTDKVDPNLLKQIPNLPLEEQKQVLSLLEELEEAESKEKARDFFMGFVNRVWPAFIEGRHHKIMANAFERVASSNVRHRHQVVLLAVHIDGFEASVDIVWIKPKFCHLTLFLI